MDTSLASRHRSLESFINGLKSNAIEHHVSWYPSCGDWEFHPLLYFKSKFLDVAKIQPNKPYFEPDWWVFSDPCLSNPYKKWDFKSDQTLHRDDRTSIILQNLEPLQPGPSRTQLAEGVRQCEAAWFCTVAIQSRTLGNYTASVLFFAGDNIDLLTRLFIGENRLPLTHLYWICDGWTTGMGNDQRRDDNFLFLKKLALSLGTKWAISEYIENYDGEADWPPELQDVQADIPSNLEFHRISKALKTVRDQNDVYFYEALKIS